MCEVVKYYVKVLVVAVWGKLKERRLTGVLRIGPAGSLVDRPLSTLATPPHPCSWAGPPPREDLHMIDGEQDKSLQIISQA